MTREVIAHALKLPRLGFASETNDSGLQW